MQRQAFTLVELLVVIAIIGLLSTIATVSMSTAREKARVAAGNHFSSSLDNSIGTQAVGWWNLSVCSGTTDNDLSGYGNALVLTGAPAWASDSPTGQGCSLALDGTEYGKVAAFKSQPTGNVPVTVAGWVKLSSLTNFAAIACLGIDAASAGYGIILNNGKFSALFSAYDGQVFSNTSPQTGKWYFVTGVYTGTTNSVYVDGRLEKTANFSTAALAAGQASVGTWCGHTTDNALVGNISNVRIVSSALSAAAVKNLYLAEKGRFDRLSER